MFLFDLEKVEDGLVELKMEIDEEQFNPHGVGHWVTPEGDYIVYVISHQEQRDTVESFYFVREEKRLKHRATFEHVLFRQLNDIVVVGLDEFYVTVDHYFSRPILKQIESLLALPLSTVVYYNKLSGSVKSVAGGLSYANGIAQSNNHRYFWKDALLCSYSFFELSLVCSKHALNSQMLYTKIKYYFDNVILQHFACSAMQVYLCV